VLSLELPVSLQVEIALHVPDRKNVADLRADPEHARFEVAERRARAAVAGELLIGVADQADVKLLGQELRRPPVEMPVDTVLVVQVGVSKL
jgi:hypothetical protein